MRRSSHQYLVLAALAVVTLVTFAGVLGNGWLLYDDPQYVTANPHVNRGLTLDGMRWFLVHPHAGNWHPLTSWSHMLDVQLFGLAPVGPHAVNLVLHALNAALLVWVLFRLTGAWWRSAAVGALFALHPLRVESVAWVAERKDLLSGLFFLLTLAAYRHWLDRPGPLRYAILLIAFVLGLMSTPMLVTLPFVLVLLAVWPFGRLARLATVAVTVIVWRRAAARRYLAVGWLWYLGTLLPVLGVVQVGGQAHADRYTYIPTIGLLVALTWWVADAVRNRPSLARAVA